MKKDLKVHYPWAQTPPGSSFFVPTLAPHKTRQAGLLAALHCRVKAVAAFGIKDGKHGVLFTRKTGG
jgi:hypothetical protein